MHPLDEQEIINPNDEQALSRLDRRRFLRTGAGAVAAVATADLLVPIGALAAPPHLSNKPYTIEFFAGRLGRTAPPSPRRPILIRRRC